MESGSDLMPTLLIPATAALGAPVDVLVAGSDGSGAAQAASTPAGVKKVLVADAPACAHPLAEWRAAALAAMEVA
jgi:electron transfer flavoprotein alpha subunit